MNQGPAKAETLPPERGLLVESLLLAAVALLALNFHPFGSAHLRRHFSQDLFYAWFGAMPWVYPRDSARVDGSRPVVVLIDEAALAARGGKWPATRRFHTQMLAELGVLRPRAILLDFLMLDAVSAEDACAFLETAGRLRSEGVKLYVAVTRSADLAVLGAADCRSASGEPLSPETVLTAVSVRRLADEADFTSRRYPFATADATPSGMSALPSAAVRMYCDTPNAGARCLTDFVGAFRPEEGFELAWSPDGDVFNRRWSTTPCGQTSATGRLKLDNAMLPANAGCPPIATLFATALLDPSSDGGFGSDNAGLFDLIEGSTVFVGGSFRGSGDLIATPMHAELPGIYYHADAFENLAAFHGRPKIRAEYRPHRFVYCVYDLAVLWALAGIYLTREKWLATVGQSVAPFKPSQAVRRWVAVWIARTPAAVTLGIFAASAVLLAAYPVLQAATLAFAVVAWVALEFAMMTRLELAARSRSMGIYLIMLAISLGVVIGAIWIGYCWMGLPPGDWAGYVSFSMVGFFVAHWAVVEFGRSVGVIRGQSRRKRGIE